MVEAQIAFDRVLRLHLEELTGEGVSPTFDWREELVGTDPWSRHHGHQRPPRPQPLGSSEPYDRAALHGGVISAALDAAGGLTAMMAAAAQSDDADLPGRFSRLGTIDLRVDYLRPGIGEAFRASGIALWTGSRVAASRMELRNDTGTLIAVGTGTYIAGRTPGRHGPGWAVGGSGRGFWPLAAAGSSNDDRGHLERRVPRCC